MTTKPQLHNERRKPMIYTTKKINEGWDVVNTETGQTVVKNETYQIADNICFSLNNPNHREMSECDEIAMMIEARLERMETNV